MPNIKQFLPATFLIFALLLMRLGTAQAACSPAGSGSATVVTCSGGTNDVYDNPNGTTINSIVTIAGETASTISNEGVLTGAVITANTNGRAINISGNVTDLSNSGSITGVWGIWNTAGSVNTFTNTGVVSGSTSYGMQIGGSGNFSSILNIGSGALISGALNGGIVNTSGSGIGTLTNTGSITGGLFGIRNYPNVGAFGTLNNLQGAGNSNGALVLSGDLPTHYNIIINSPTAFGQIATASGSNAVSGTTIFNIYGNTGTSLVTGVAASTIAAGTYLDVLQGISLSSITSGSTGTYNGYGYSLVADTRPGYSGDYNLVVTAPLLPNITGVGTIYPLSGVNTSFFPVFDGGTLQISNATPNSSAFTVNANNGVIDQNGSQTNFTGVISNQVSGTPGSITVTNTGSGGAVVFSNANTYTGTTTINNGATLALSGAGSIALSSGVIANGTFDISNTNSGASIQALSGGGTIALGSQNLAITNAAGAFSGTVGGSGGLSISGGSQVLSGVNGYTGSTSIGTGATLALSSTGSIATSNGVINSGTFDISASTGGVTVQAISGSGNVSLGAQNIAVSNASGNLAGAIGGTGGLSVTGGSQTLSGVNTYSGSTVIGAGASLALSGSGSIAASSSLTNAGTFDISTTTSGASVKAITGSGALALGAKNLVVTSASGNFSGAIAGSGGINIAAGNQTLSGNNASGFTGSVQVQSGAALTIPSASALGSGTLALIGSSSIPATLNVTGDASIANAITVTADPVFNISPGTTTTASSPITNGTAPGDLLVQGGGTLALTAANTYTGLTNIAANSTLVLSGAGSIANSSSVTNNGTFNIAGKSSNVTISNYTQGSSGTLAMSFAPSGNQKLNVTGATSLAGSLALTAMAGSYAAGRYTLLTSSGGVTGTFGTLSSGLSSYTNLASYISYDANDVYLNLFMNGPSAADTQQSLANNSYALQNIYALQNAVLSNSFSYDCNEFGVNGICVSAGGRNTAVSAANGLNNTSGLLIAAYRPHPNYRIGAYADQNLSVNNAGSIVNLGNNTPLIGIFSAWSERLDGTGTEVKVAAAYGQKNATVTRQVVGTSEPGSGSSQLNSQGAQFTAKYGFAVLPKLIVAPYIGIRYTQNNMSGYTEGISSTVTAPLTYAALNTNATTALAGLGTSYKVTQMVGVFGSAGMESDTNTASGTYSATGVSGLTPISFNANPVKTRATVMLGAFYDVDTHQRLGITGIYRQESFQVVSATTVMATYTAGL